MFTEHFLFNTKDTLDKIYIIGNNILSIFNSLSKDKIVLEETFKRLKEVESIEDVSDTKEILAKIKKNTMLKVKEINTLKEYNNALILSLLNSNSILSSYSEEMLFLKRNIKSTINKINKKSEEDM